MENKKDTLIQQVSNSFTRFENSINGDGSSAWNKTRIKAINNLNSKGFPGRKSEEYKYTPIIRKLEKSFTDFQFWNTPKPIKIDTSEYIPDGLEASTLFFINGVFDNSHTRILDDGLKITPLPKAMKEKEVLQILEKSAQSQDSFSLLNSVFSNEGAVINIDKSNSLVHPVFIIHITDGSIVNIVQPRVIITAKENCEATITEVFYTLGNERILNNTNTNINLSRNSTIRYYRAAMVNNQTFLVNNTVVEQAQDSTFTSVTVDMGGDIVRNNLSISQNGEGCETHMYGLYAASGNSHIDNHTSVDHRFPHTESNELYKGILTDNSTGVFNGKIFVRKEAQKTNAFQQNHNILLSDDARINTKPQLEIWADDVKCSHGCTTGQLDNEQIFYLRSRGLSESDAKAMLLHAYALDILDHISIDPLRLLLDEKVMKILRNS